MVLGERDDFQRVCYTQCPGQSGRAGLSGRNRTVRGAGCLLFGQEAHPPTSLWLAPSAASFCPFIPWAVEACRRNSVRTGLGY